MFEVGQSWENEWVINNELYQKFLAISKDYNPIHTDSNFAKASGFDDKIVHGNLLNCFISFFIGEMLPTKNLVIIRQQIKFVNAFYIDDVIQLSAFLSKYNPSVNFIQFEFQFMNKELKIASGNIQVKLI